MTLTDAPPEEPAAPARRHTSAVVLAVAALLLVAALVLIVIGIDARSSASDDRDHATAAADQRRALAKDQATVDHQREQLRKVTNAVPAKVGALESTLTDVVLAQNQFVATGNQAADLYNSGDHAGSAARFRNDGATALARMTEKNAGVRQALQAAQAAIEQLQAAQ